MGSSPPTIASAPCASSPNTFRTRYLRRTRSGARGSRRAAPLEAPSVSSWGTVPSPWRKDSLHVQLPGKGYYLLMFLSEKWSFVAVRCRDERVSYGQLERYPDVPQDRLF